jgi:hypothetical protein
MKIPLKTAYTTFIKKMLPCPAVKGAEEFAVSYETAAASGKIPAGRERLGLDTAFFYCYTGRQISGHAPLFRKRRFQGVSGTGKEVSWRIRIYESMNRSGYGKFGSSGMEGSSRY